MSAANTDHTKPSRTAGSVPTWLASGLLGLVLGTGATYLGMQYYFGGYEHLTEGADAASQGGAPGVPPAIPPPPGGGMMGGGGAGGMMGMAGGGGGGKRNLTSLVGKLELLSRPDLKLQIELDAEQAKGVADKLAAIDQAENMTADEAQSHLDDLESLLTAEQKSTLGLIGLPVGRPGGGASDDNPFAQESNQKRLRDLLGRLAPESVVPESSTDPAAKPDAEASEAPKGTD